MPQKLIVTLLAAVALVIVILGIMSMTKKKKPETAEESSAVISGTEMLIIPSEMPERISMDVDPAFTETNSAYYDKYYVCNDASVIVTGEKLSIYGQTVKEYGDSVLQQYQQTADDFALLSDETIPVSEVECRVFDFTYAVKSDDAQQNMQCTTAVLIKDEQVYLVTCKSHLENFSIYQTAFRRMIESIRIADASALTETTVTGTLPLGTQETAVP
ncbi:MAG: hypothetical protein IKI45_08610 [Oscillospiraceae bacterium]|nr:hypothetical protein [Oscillospiraceae bacterium]